MLTADRTLIARYEVLLDGMMAASQTTTTPGPIMRTLLMPRAESVDGQAAVAPLGLRRIEAALVRSGIPREDIAVADDAHLEQFIGPATRIVAISSGEPTGLGMSSTTMAAAAGGTIYPLAMFRKLKATVQRLIAARCPDAKVILGGPGAWQVAAEGNGQADRFPDHVVAGYAEQNAGEIFRAVLDGDAVPGLVEGVAPSAGDIPPVLGATTMGVVEISRGCGLGCGFCTIATTPMVHLPLETILSDARTNIKAGNTSISILSEDFFRYGATGLNCRPEKAIGLLRALRELPGLRLIQIDHANVVSIAQFSDEQLKEVHDLLGGETGSTKPWVNIGIETASGRLLAANGGAAKMGSCRPEDWGDLCREQLLRLTRAGFIPMASLVAGLPGETEDDLATTHEWALSLRGHPVTIFPVLHAPIDPGNADPPVLTKRHWDFMRDCYYFNFKWVPKMYWDNQTGAGTGFVRKSMFQILGNGQVLLWLYYFARNKYRAPAQWT